MTNDGTVIGSYCRECVRRTQHDVLASFDEETSPEGYHERDTWQVVRCRGCLTLGFRHRNDDFERVTEDHAGNAHHEITVSTYPRAVSRHRTLDAWRLPNLIGNIYKQTLSAYGEKAYLLASIGMRATIEAVCNDLKIPRGNLEKRIDQLYKGGFVSNADKMRLHAIRFLGNDAAHEIKQPTKADLSVALDIIDHLLNTVFILAGKAKSLPMVFEAYDDFLKLLAKCVEEIKVKQAMSVAAILGNRVRQVGNHLDAFEAKLKDEVDAGKVPFLALSQSEETGAKAIQLYLPDAKAAFRFDDEIPF